jgi:hypothetical protein
MASIDFIADEEEAPKSEIDFIPDPAPAFAPAPAPIIPPDERLIAQSEKKADLFAQQQEARRTGEYWEGVTDRIDKLTGRIVEPLTRPLSGALGRASDAVVNLATGRPQNTPENPGLTEQALQRSLVNLPKAGEAETPLGKVAAGTYNAAADLINGLTSPDAISLLPAGANKAVLTAWISQMAGQTPARVMKATALFKEGKTQEAAQEIAAGVAELGMAELGRRHMVRDPLRPTMADAMDERVDPRAAQEAALEATNPRNAQRVVLPETLRELNREPAAPAVEPLAAKVEEPVVEAPAPTAEAKPAEAAPAEAAATLPEKMQGKPVAEIAANFDELAPEKLAEYQGPYGGGPTGLMHTLGSMAKTAEDVAALKDMGLRAKAEVARLKEEMNGIPDEDAKMAKLMEAAAVAGKQPWEAYEFATGMTIDGKPKWEGMEKVFKRKGMDYKPTVPSEEYLKAKAEAPAKPEVVRLATAKVNNPFGDPSGTTYRATPEDWAKWQDNTAKVDKAIAEGADFDSPELMEVRKQTEVLKNKYGGIAPEPPASSPAVKPVEVPSARTSIGYQEPRGIAAAVRERGKLSGGGEAGAISLAPLQPIATHVVDFIKGAPNAMKVVGAQLAGKSAPKTSTASVESGNALVRYASSKIAAPLVAESMATDVLGDHYRDLNFGQRLGAVLVEDRLRGIKDAFVKAGDAKAARKVNSLIGKQDSPFQTEAEFKAALADPEIRAAIDRHKATVQKVAEEAHEEAGGTLSGPGLNTGAFVNLKAIFDGGEEALLNGGGRGNLMNPLRRPSRFSKLAAGTAEKYETDYRTISQRMIEGNFQESTKRQMYDQLVRDGLAEMKNPGEEAPEIGGKPAVKFVIERKGVPAGENKARTYVKNLWVRADLAGEVRQALDVDGPIQRTAIVNAATFLNRIQLAGPTDAVWHTANMLGSIAGSQGGKSVLVDMARKLPGVNLPDAIGRVVASSIKVLAKTPDIQRQIAELADIGAMRAKGVSKEGGRLSQIANANHNLIALVDKAGRLVRDDMYKNLVNRGLVRDTPAARREWVNQMGQYNPRLMGQFQRFFKDAGFSPFVVAGRNFNRMAMRRISMDPGVKAVSPTAAAEMRAIEAFGTIATLFAVPALANYLITGSPGGRPGTKMGQIDTGKDDQGKHVVIDPAQWTGHRRGLRISGIQAVLEGAKRGETRGKITQNVIGDIMGGVIHPWAGPAVNAASVGYTGHSPTGYKESEDPNDYGKNIMAALKQLNPVAEAVFKGSKEGAGAFKETAMSLAGAVGVKEAQPFTSKQRVRTLYRKWAENNPDPKLKAEYERNSQLVVPVSAYQPLDEAIFKGDEAKAVKAIQDLIATGKNPKQIVDRMKPFAGEGTSIRERALFKGDTAAFRNSLTEEQKGEYKKALDERKAAYQSFLKAWRNRGSAAPATSPKIDFTPDEGQ